MYTFVNIAVVRLSYDSICITVVLVSYSCCVLSSCECSNYFSESMHAKIAYTIYEIHKNPFPTVALIF